MDERILSTILSSLVPLFGIFNERSKRALAGTFALALGRGGIAAVHRATGLSRPAIRRGIKELGELENIQATMRIRKPGGGRKKITDTNPLLVPALEQIISPATRGCPMNPLLWTTKSLRKIVAELQERGHSIGVTALRKLLKQQGYSLQSNRKTRDGKDHPDRDAQFCYINDRTKEFLAEGAPVISVDTKKKENIGNFSNKGQEYQPKKHPVETNIHDFPDEELGKAIPYGIFDIENNEGFVNIGITSDTSEFAVNSIETWWNDVGKKRFPIAKKLLITADCGGSNGYRTRLWKKKLREFCDKYKLDITVCHYPPGTSKWNKIEHKLFSFISMNWRGRPLVDMVTIVNLISNTKTSKGLQVRCVVDKRHYATKIKVSDEDFNALNITPHDFHGEWNYTIKHLKQKE